MVKFAWPRVSDQGSESVSASDVGGRGRGGISE